MPPKRKRQADDDDDSSDEESREEESPPPVARSSSSSTTKSKKLSAEERAAVRERARLAMQKDSSANKKKQQQTTPSSKAKKKSNSSEGTPSKRRKLNNDDDDDDDDSHKNNHHAASPARAAPAPTTPAAAVSAGSDKKAQLQAARARAAQWAKEQKKPAGSTSTTSSRRQSTGTTPSTSVVKDKKPKAKPSGGSRRKSTGSAPVAAVAAAANTNDDDHIETMPMPPSRFPSAVPAPNQDRMYVPPDNSNNLRHLQQQKQKSPVQSPRNDNTNQEAENEQQPQYDYDFLDETEEKVYNLRATCFKYLVVPFLAIIAMLVLSGSLIYNADTGMLMLLGSKPVPYERTYVIDDQTTAPAFCYHNTPPEILHHTDIDQAFLGQLQSPIGCNEEVIKPCPHGAICYRGHWLQCYAPLWQPMLQNTTEETTCILSLEANTTYQGVVELLETRTMQQLCLNHLGGSSPLSYYTASASEQDSEGNAVMDLSSTSSGVMTSAESVPLYGLSEVFQNLHLDYDSQLLQMANTVHDQLVFPQSPECPDVVLVGLSLEHFALVEQTRLSLACKASRRMVGCLDAISQLTLALLKFLLSITWHCMRYHPLMSFGISLVTGIFVIARRRKIRHAWQTQEVNRIRQLTLQRLQNPGAPGEGLRQGEMSVMHLRDSLSWDLYAEDDLKRREFLFDIWPRVVRQIQQDNRVRKQHRPLAGVGREIWTWVATKEKK